MNNQNSKKKSLERRLQDFLASYRGKIMLNYAYSWGAAIVILGALFKLTHLPGANVMLFAGMGAEVLVFFISAFDRPYKSYKWESVFPNIKISGTDSAVKKDQSEAEAVSQEDPMAAILNAQRGQQFGAGPIIIGGGGYVPSGAIPTPNASAENLSVAPQPTGGGTVIQGGVMPSIVTIPTGGGGVSSMPGVEVSPEMKEATTAYLEQLKEMTEALTRFVEQTKSMGQDAEQINILNKNLSGINAIYEIQLRSASAQLGTIDDINTQSRKMARQIDELNAVYARMLEAMTVNMK